MKRVIYSLYVDVPESQHYATNFDFELNHNRTRVKETRDNFKTHYRRLLDNKIKYCDSIGVPFKMYEYDEEYKKYVSFFRENYPEIIDYEIVNFYKIKKLYDLSQEYDEILYLDFDAIPVSKDNFFEAWDLTKGICVLNNDDQIRRHKPIHKLNQSTRSPTAKFYNAQAMLMENNKSPDNNVINTGIIGVNKEHIQKLDYFENFKDTLNLMTKLRLEEDGMFPDNIRKIFRYDNETIFSFKVKMNDVPIQWFDDEWHYFFSKQKFIPENTKIVHAICKDFDTVWRFNEKHNF